MFRALSVALCLASSLGATGFRVATFNIGAHFNETYFDYSLGAAGTVDHDRVREILARIDADVVALQEIHSTDLSAGDLDALAFELGYPHVHVASRSGAFDSSLQVAFLSRFPLLETGSIGSPAGAKEMTRLIPHVAVDVPGTERDPVLLSVHLKSGTSDQEKFRRAVEMRRAAEWLAASGLEAHDNFIVLGDFNPSGTDESFAALPPGLPGSFVLGSDVGFPVAYSTTMTSYFSGLVPVALDPRQLDGSAATYEFGQTLDRLLVSPGLAGRPHAAEIYNSALDGANGEGLAKAGSPLAEATSREASDHYVVFADLELGEELPGAYAFHQPGETLEEDFDGFAGLYEPVLWDGDVTVWRGPDDGSMSAEGGRAYGNGTDVAVGFLGGSGMVLETRIVNEAAAPLTVLDLGFAAGQWRSAFGGAEDRIEVEIVAGGVATPVPGLAFIARTDLPDGPVPGGMPQPKSARVRGLSVAPGNSFDLRFRFVPGSGTAPPSDDAWINECHYDNAGSDVGEFVEVVVGPGFGGSLSDLEVLLYNGSTPGAAVVYDVLNLGADFGEAGDYGGYRIFVADLPPGGLQNGGNDGLAVVNVATTEVLHVVSYEGVFTAAEGLAAGWVSSDIGVAEDGGDAAGGSVGMLGGGAEASGFGWGKFAAHTKGAPNAGQDFVPAGLPPQGLAVDELTLTFVPDADGDGRGDDEDADDDNDGQEDAFELAFGTDPQDAGSRFEVSLAHEAAGPVLRFPGADGVSYIIEWGDDLMSWDHSAAVVGTGEEMVFMLPMAGGKGFARVAAE